MSFRIIFIKTVLCIIQENLRVVPTSPHIAGFAEKIDYSIKEMLPMVFSLKKLKSLSNEGFFLIAIVAFPTKVKPN
jgi:hypothetical protein